MDIFDVLTMLGGLCLFLFGMNVMGDALERRAGSKLRDLLSKLTTNRFMGFLTGLLVTAIIQSSSATTVMVVGFANSGLMNLGQAINVIMGANVGTTVTAWIVSLSSIGGGGAVTGWLKLLKPSSFTPVLALIGVVLFVFCKASKKKDTGAILLGFATLMYGMETMSDAVQALENAEWFQNMFIMFAEQPIVAMLVGAGLTAILQSSSASVGILQALSMTGAITNGAALPIMMGMGIGTCITAVLSCIGANKEAKRAAMAHLSFNIIGSVVFLAGFMVIDSMFTVPVFDAVGTPVSLAFMQTVFKLLYTALLLPMAGLLEKLSCLLVPDSKSPETVIELDDRLLETPSIALEHCHDLAIDMARTSVEGLKGGLLALTELTPELSAKVRELEDKGDHYEDILGTYLVKLSSHAMSERDSMEASKLLRLIGDFERISDHGVGVLAAAEELKEKGMALSAPAYAELSVITAAITEIMDLSLRAFEHNDLHAAAMVEPLEEVIDDLKEKLRANHITRLQQGACTIEAGFVWADLLTDLERAADHCSNIAACVIDLAHRNMNLHETLRATRESDKEFEEMYHAYAERFALS
ncbi:MAG: Na/Pi cotransporter family protein [Clostridia bacterium]|nr:Na/Pi cotransporter family protein [Clostridia bacterium]